MSKRGVIEISGHVARLFLPGKISCICATFFLSHLSFSRSFIQFVAFWRIPRILCHVPRFVFSVVRRERIGGSASTILSTSSFACPSIFRVSLVSLSLSRFVPILLCLQKTTEIQFHVGKLFSESEWRGCNIKQTLADNYTFDIFFCVDFLVLDIIPRGIRKLSAYTLRASRVSLCRRKKTLLPSIWSTLNFIDPYKISTKINFWNNLLTLVKF